MRRGPARVYVPVPAMALDYSRGFPGTLPGDQSAAALHGLLQTSWLQLLLRVLTQAPG